MAKSDSSKQSLGKHLEGWQPGLVAVVLAGVVALLAVPRPVVPTELPVPLVEPRRLEEIARADDRAARSAIEKPLDADVRALGSLLRAFGEADANAEETRLAFVRAQIGPAAARARLQGEGALVALRAYQMSLFLREVRGFLATGKVSTDLVELGGPFVDLLQRNGWCEGEAPCKMHMDEAALRASFKKRWSEISGLSGGALDLTVSEERALFRFLLAHPPKARKSPTSPHQHAADSSFLLRKVDELSALDPTYPRDLARGIIHLQKGDGRRAATFFSTYLDAQPDGPYALRAQNYLRAALEIANDAD